MTTYQNNHIEILQEQGCKSSFEIKFEEPAVSKNYDSPEDIVFFNEQLPDETSQTVLEHNDNDDKEMKYDNTDVSRTKLMKTNDTDNKEVKNFLLDMAEVSEKPKILVQRFFLQSANHVVEPKLDFVIARSESDITKHVFGGLFNTKYYPYVPENYCRKHSTGLFEFIDESLPKIGDKFDSLESFRLYIDSKARQWKYYLKCADSHRKNGKDTFVFKCVFAKPKSYTSKAKGLRKRTRRVPLHDCPCRVLVKAVPLGAKDLTVIYVCNHHDHPLTDEYFYKLQHGRRLHPSIREELMDILSLDVEREIVKRYFESITGYSMNNGFFANVLLSMKKNKVKRQFSMTKLKEMFQKIEKIRQELLYEKDNEDNPDDIELEDSMSTNKSRKNIEVINLLNSESAPKRTYIKRIKNMEAATFDPNIKRSRGKKRRNLDLADISGESVNNKSRLERRLQQLHNDEKTLQNVKHLQASVRTETNLSSDRISDIQELDTSNSTNGDIDVTVSIEHVAENDIEDTDEIIESSHCDNDIFYENEVTVVGTTAENESEYMMTYENVESGLLSNNDSDDIHYCLQYNNDDGQSNDPFILMENLEKMPAQIQATELATFNIEHENNNTDVDNIKNVFVNSAPTIKNNFEAVGQLSNNTTLNTENENVYEIIETNDKKILPDRKFVRNVILNKGDNECTKNMKNYVSRKRGRPRKINKITKFTKDSSDEHKYMQKVIKSEIGIDLNNLEDSDHYLIVVDSDSEKDISSCDEETVELKESSNAQHIINMESRKNKLEHDIYKLRKFKEKLKKDVRTLSAVKNGLLRDIKEVSTNS